MRHCTYGAVTCLSVNADDHSAKGTRPSIRNNSIYRSATLDVAGTVVPLAATGFLNGPAWLTAELAHLSLFCAVRVGKTGMDHAVRTTLASVSADTEPTQFVAVAGFTNCRTLRNAGSARIRLWRRQIKVHSLASCREQQRRQDQ